jgi:branched-chain amino acid transport system ATP-binding protein
VVENLLVARHGRIVTGILAEGLFARGVRKEEARHRRVVEEVLEFVELERYRHARVDALPFGVQKIVGFARALAMSPQALLLDEPSAGLNREEREDLARHILRIRHELGIAMLWVEHDMQMVADLADRICVLDYGRLIAEGPPEQVLSDPRVVEAYVGTRGPSGGAARA